MRLSVPQGSTGAADSIRQSADSSCHWVAGPALGNLISERYPWRNLLARAGYPEDVLRDPEGRIPIRLLHEFWHEIADATGDPTPGLSRAQVATVNDFDVLGSMLAHARTGEEALSRLCRFGRLWSNAWMFDYEADGRLLRIRYETLGSTAEEARHDVEFSLAMVVSVLSGAFGYRFQAEEAWFRHSPATRPGGYDHFFRTSRFRAATNLLILPASILRRSLNDRIGRLGAVIETLAEDLLAKDLANEDPVTEIGWVIHRAMDTGQYDIASVANGLGISVRTLQRRLHHAGTSFGAVVDGARRSRATSLLTHSKLPLAEIALLSGFSETSAFARAFRRWEGITPSEYRNAGSTGNIGNGKSARFPEPTRELEP